MYVFFLSDQSFLSLVRGREKPCMYVYAKSITRGESHTYRGPLERQAVMSGMKRADREFKRIVLED